MLYLKIFKIIKGTCVCWGNLNNSFRIQYIHEYTWIWNFIDVKTPDFSSKMLNFIKNRHFRKSNFVTFDKRSKVHIFMRMWFLAKFWGWKKYLGKRPCTTWLYSNVFVKLGNAVDRGYLSIKCVRSLSCPLLIDICMTLWRRQFQDCRDIYWWHLKLVTKICIQHPPSTSIQGGSFFILIWLSRRYDLTMVQHNQNANGPIRVHNLTPPRQPN